MALIICPECGQKISDKSPACIHCGYPLQEIKKYETIWNGHDVSKINEYLDSLNANEKQDFILFCEYIEDRNKPLVDPTKKNTNKPFQGEYYNKFYDFMAELGYYIIYVAKIIHQPLNPQLQPTKSPVRSVDLFQSQQRREALTSCGDSWDLNGLHTMYARSVDTGGR